MTNDSANLGSLSKDVFSEVESFLSRWRLRHEIPGAGLVIVYGTEMAHLYCSGVSSLASGARVQPNTQFALGSTTKSMTALAVLQLIEQGKVQLDIPIQTYVRWFDLPSKEAASAITIRQLIAHTSGLGGRPDPDTPSWRAKGDSALEAWVRQLATVNLVTPPGSRFVYSVDGYALLGVLIQEVTGQTFADYMREHIFMPLGMFDTTARPEDAKPQLLADGHYRFDPNYLQPIPPYMVPAYAPSGWVISTTQDIGRYLIAQLNKGEIEGCRVLSIEGMQLSHTPQVMLDNKSGYAFGWVVGRSRGSDRDGPTTIEHEGHIATASSALLLIPQLHLGIGLLTNARVSTILEASRAISDMLAPHIFGDG